MEWKVRRTGFRSGSSNDKDIKWLKDHCKNHPATIGYAVWLNLEASPVEISVDRIDSNGMRRLPC
jgi:hypothetical protein